MSHLKKNIAWKTIRATGPMKWNSTEKRVKKVQTKKRFGTEIKKNIIADYIYDTLIFYVVVMYKYLYGLTSVGL